MREHGEAVGAAQSRRKSGDGGAQHIHVGIALGQRPPCGFASDEQRLWREAASLLDPRPQQPQRTEFGQRQELVGVGAEPRVDHAVCLLERGAGAFEGTEIFNRRCQDECELLSLRSAGIVDYPAIGNDEEALEAQGGEILAASVTAGTISAQEQGLIPRPRRRRADRDRSGCRKPPGRCSCS